MPASGPVAAEFEILFLFKAILQSGLRVEYMEMTIDEQKLLSFDGK
jgi:hypothetical protein